MFLSCLKFKTRTSSSSKLVFILTPRKKENMTSHEFIAPYRFYGNFEILATTACENVITSYKEVIGASV